MSKFSDFMELVDEKYCSNPELRFGQALMDTLHTVDRKLYDEITYETDIDCFYDTMKAEETMFYIEEKWSE
jgi:hypothetical protein